MRHTFNFWIHSKVIAQKHYFDFLAISQKHYFDFLAISQTVVVSLEFVHSE